MSALKRRRSKYHQVEATNARSPESERSHSITPTGSAKSGMPGSGSTVRTYSRSVPGPMVMVASRSWENWWGTSSPPKSATLKGFLVDR